MVSCSSSPSISPASASFGGFCPSLGANCRAALRGSRYARRGVRVNAYAPSRALRAGFSCAKRFVRIWTSSAAVAGRTDPASERSVPPRGRSCGRATSTCCRRTRPAAAAGCAWISCCRLAFCWPTRSTCPPRSRPIRPTCRCCARRACSPPPPPRARGACSSPVSASRRITSPRSTAWGTGSPTTASSR